MHLRCLRRAREQSLLLLDEFVDRLARRLLSLEILRVQLRGLLVQALQRRDIRLGLREKIGDRPRGGNRR